MGLGSPINLRFAGAAILVLAAMVTTGFIGVLNDHAKAAETPTLGPICLALFALTLAGLGAMFLNRPR